MQLCAASSSVAVLRRGAAVVGVPRLHPQSCCGLTRSHESSPTLFRWCSRRLSIVRRVRTSWLSAVWVRAVASAGVLGLMAHEEACGGCPRRGSVSAAADVFAVSGVNASAAGGGRDLPWSARCWCWRRRRGSSRWCGGCSATAEYKRACGGLRDKRGRGRANM